MNNINYYKQVIKKILTFIFSLLALYITFKVSIFYVPFLIAIIIGILLEPMIRKCMRITNFTRKTSAIIILIITVLVIIGLLIIGIIGLVNEVTKILDNFNNIVENISQRINEITYWINLDKFMIPNQVKEIITNMLNDAIGEGSNIVKVLLNNFINFLKNMPQIFIYLGITILATYFVCTDRLYILDQIEHHIPKDWVNKGGKKLRKVIKSLGEYLKAQAILIGISFIIVLIGLLVLKLFKMNIEYPILMALIIGFVDALPILGSGTVMIPWAVISAWNGDINLGLAIIILYAITLITRQLVEPKVISGKIGIHPIFTLISMYTGFRLIGIIGMFVGPIILIILKNIFENMIDNGVVKTIFYRK